MRKLLCALFLTCSRGKTWQGDIVRILCSTVIKQGANIVLKLIGPSQTKMLLEEKSTKMFMGNFNMVTHLYTTQYGMTASGKLLPKVFLCMQEKDCKFRPLVQKKIDDLAKRLRNVYITSSKSGQLMKEHVRCIQRYSFDPYVVKKKR